MFMGRKSLWLLKSLPPPPPPCFKTQNITPIIFVIIFYSDWWLFLAQERNVRHSYYYILNVTLSPMAEISIFQRLRCLISLVFSRWEQRSETSLLHFRCYFTFAGRTPRISSDISRNCISFARLSYSVLHTFEESGPRFQSCSSSVVCLATNHVSPGLLG